METEIAPAPSDFDVDLAAEVYDAIMALDSVRPTRAEVQVTAVGGRVTLTGIVQSPMAAAEVERAAADVPGVIEVDNQLYDDGTLTREVAEALARDPRTRDIPPGYRVVVLFGRVTIVGYFNNDQARALMAVCQNVPGVRDVAVKTLG